MTEFTKRSLLPLAALLFVLAITACAGALSSAEDTAPLPGETLPAEAAYGFTLPSGLEGDVSLDSYAGEQNVVLVFYRGFW
jgi:hypothetical protein